MIFETERISLFRKYLMGHNLIKHTGVLQSTLIANIMYIIHFKHLLNGCIMRSLKIFIIEITYVLRRHLTINLF